MDEVQCIYEDTYEQIGMVIGKPLTDRYDSAKTNDFVFLETDLDSDDDVYYNSMDDTNLLDVDYYS